MSYSRPAPPNEQSKGGDLNLPESTILILRRNGIPPAVASILLAESKSVMCSLRGNDSDRLPNTQRLSYASCPKPGSVQAKTTKINNHPSDSTVSIDPDFSPAELNQEGILVPSQRNEGDLPKDQPAVSLKNSLQEIIAKIESKDYELVMPEGGFEGSIIFKIADRSDLANKIKDTLYQINLNPNDTVNCIPPESIKSKDALGVESANILKKPTWWDNEELGNYEKIANYSFTVQYKKSEVDEFKDFMIAGKLFNGKILPIISDPDQFELSK